MDTSPSPQTPWDVLIVGGGAAGLAAALQLVRSRRSVLVVDNGEPRNSPAAHMHAYLGHDGRPPAEFLAIAREEVRRYGGVVRAGQVVTADGDVDSGFRVVTADGQEPRCARLVLATGLIDELPDIPGLREQWGRGVIHCPYCHGWEVRDQRLVVLGTGPMTAHQALLFRQLSADVTVVLHVPDVLGEQDRGRLVARGISLVAAPVAEVLSDDGALRGVRLGDGTVLDADAVVVGPRFRARSELLARWGIAPVPAPGGKGDMVEVDVGGRTAVPGVYAAGNIADVSHQVLGAAAEGSRVGAMLNADLVMAEADRAVARPGDGAADWDGRYAEKARWWSGAPNAALVAEAGDLAPGRALDVGCGEGADAIWLAGRGWKVTGLDISEVALARAAAAADAADVAIDWIRADLALDPPDALAYDLVSVHYPALRHTDGNEAIRALVQAVAPGGRLLVVGHDTAGGPQRRRGVDPAEHVQPADVAARLGDGWVIEVQQTRPRIPPPGFDGPDVPDAVLLARRS